MNDCSACPQHSQFDHVFQDHVYVVIKSHQSACKFCSVEVSIRSVDSKNPMTKKRSVAWLENSRYCAPEYNLRSAMVCLTFVAFHHHPYLGTHTFVNELCEYQHIKIHIMDWKFLPSGRSWEAILVGYEVVLDTYSAATSRKWQMLVGGSFLWCWLDSSCEDFEIQVLV